MLHEMTAEVGGRGYTIGRSAVSCIHDPSENHGAENGREGDVQEIIQNPVCPTGAFSEEPLAAEKGYDEKQCRYHMVQL